MSGRELTWDSAHFWWLDSCSPQGDQVTSTMHWYSTQPHYPDTELTNSCSILRMLNIWQGRKQVWMFKSLVWLDQASKLLCLKLPISEDGEKRLSIHSVIPPGRVFAVYFCACVVAVTCFTLSVYIWRFDVFVFLDGSSLITYMLWCCSIQCTFGLLLMFLRVCSLFTSSVLMLCSGVCMCFCVISVYHYVKN